MPRPVAILTLEELAAKFEHVREKRRASNKRYCEKHPEMHRAYYELHKEALNKHTTEVRRKKRLANKTAAGALPTLPHLI